MKDNKSQLFQIVVVALLGVGGVASAAVTGNLVEGPCGGGGVTVTATTITWLPASATDSTRGCVISGAGTNLMWDGGAATMGPGIMGAIKDLVQPGPPTVDEFIDFPFPTVPGFLDFVLTGIGPGSPATGMAACQSASTNAALTCSVLANSPFVLSLAGAGSNSTVISLHAFGTIQDPLMPADTSDWNGGFSVTLANTLPIDVYNSFTQNGTLTEGQTGSFGVTFSSVPEPASVSALFLGGIGLIGVGWKRRSKR